MHKIIRLTGKILLAGLLSFLILWNSISLPAAAISSSPLAAASSSSAAYVTPEQYGAKGDGVTDDTAAFEKCMKSTTKYVLLSKTYLISSYLTAFTEKYFYAQPKNGAAGATIICNPNNDYKTLAFYAGVTFENVEFYSTILRTGTSAHGETYRRTSNGVFVEVWEKSGTFYNCSFINALIAIRGRKSSSSTVIPKNITVKQCVFTECKMPIQGYCKDTVVNNSIFVNDGELYCKLDHAQVNPSRYNGDLYSGDHCIYMERYGCSSLMVTGCTVETRNCSSGAAFQIYGTPKSGDPIPALTVDNCTISANSIVSTSAANVLVKNTVFNEQQDKQYILRAVSGSILVQNSEFNHTYAFCYADTNVKPYAVNCTFRLMTDMGSTRCNFPLESYHCTYINWGGNVRVNNTLFSDCIFTRDGANVLNKLYISNSPGYQISLVNTHFKAGDTITNNVSSVTNYTNCGTFN